MFIKVLSILALLVCSFFASAATILNADDFLTKSHSGYNVDFTDAFTFTVPNDNNGSVSITNNPLLNALGGFYKYNLIKLSLTAVAANPTLTFTTAPDGSYQSSSLLSGTYSFDVTGTTAGYNGGAYTTVFSPLPSSVISAVPLPAAVWLFGAALLGLTGLNRRKQATD